MPTAKRNAKTTKTSTKDSQEISIQLPKMNRSMYMPALVVLLIIASFLLGDFYAQLNILNGGKGIFNMGQQPTPTQAAGAGATGLQPVPIANNISVGHLPVKGQTNAPITMIEFADFRCPYCDRFFKDTEPQLLKNYVDSGKIKFYFRQYPFLPTSQTDQTPTASTLAANASECANDQGYFWQMHDYFYQNQPSETDVSMYTVDNLTSVAEGLHMDSDAFNSCLMNKTDNSKVSADYSDGQKAGVNGTPAFVINGRLVTGALSYTDFQTVFDCVAKNGTVLQDPNTGQIGCK